jgi:hypothetical protein
MNYDTTKYKNVLYCGMAYDIMCPFIFTPDLEVLYAMDLFDDCYCTRSENKSERSLEIQRDDIINCLNGKPKPLSKGTLPYKATILEEIRTSEYFSLLFEYNNKKRKLHIFSMNYRTTKWPDIIKDIDALITIGAPFPISSKCMANKTKQKCKIMYNNTKEMVNERLRDEILYVPGLFWESDIHFENIKYIMEPFPDDEFNNGPRYTYDDDIIEYVITNKNNIGLLVEDESMVDSFL